MSLQFISSYSSTLKNWKHPSAHFEAASKNERKSKSEQAALQNLRKWISSKQYLLILFAMWNVLCDLLILSEALQKRDITSVLREVLISRYIGHLEAMEK